MTPSPVNNLSTSAATESICARRGNQWLTKDDLEAHLAAVVRLENVGILLGAGASAGALGGVTMADLWTDFTKCFQSSTAWLRREGFISAGENVNVEKITDALEITRLEWKRVNRPRKLQELKRAHADVLRSVVRGSLLQQPWWEEPSMVDIKCEELASHRQLLQKLTAARQPGQPSPWVFTTNYDLAVEWAAETMGLKVTNGFDGLHRRVFSPHNFDLGYRNMLARGEARFGTYSIYIAKLHGSLTWQTAGREQSRNIRPRTFGRSSACSRRKNRRCTWTLHLPQCCEVFADGWVCARRAFSSIHRVPSQTAKLPHYERLLILRRASEQNTCERTPESDLATRRLHSQCSTRRSGPRSWEL